MRDRLIELMQGWGNKNTDSFPFESVADFLLENGVIVPPYKVGDTVYVIADDLYWEAVVRSVWLRFSNYEEDDFVAVEFRDGDIKSYYGREIYFTKEEAEQALSKLQASYEQVKEGAE